MEGREQLNRATDILAEAASSFRYTVNSRPTETYRSYSLQAFLLIPIEITAVSRRS